MKILGSLYWIVILVLVAISGCTTTLKMEPAQPLTKEQAIVFGKVNVIVDGRYIKMTTSGFKSYLTVEFRKKGSSTIMEYKIDETGYFYWALAPGEYEVLGTYGLAAVGTWEMGVPLAQRVWIPFTVEPGKSLYLGEITLELSKNRHAKQRLDDNYSEAIKEFKKKYPNTHTGPLKKVTNLEPFNPGTYTKVTDICSGDWGIDCSLNSIGVTPTSPDRRQDIVISSTVPTFRWEPSSVSGVKYDVVIYEAYDSTWRKINLDLVTGKERWRPGRLQVYAQDLTAPAFKPDASLLSDTTYLWSVRLRRGDTVSTWSQVKHTLVRPNTFWWFAVEQWEAWFNFTTPNK